jgi:carbonic anhydrase
VLPAAARGAVGATPASISERPTGACRARLSGAGLQGVAQLGRQLRWLERRQLLCQQPGRQNARMTGNPHPGQDCSADEALARLKAGNLRFVRGESHLPHLQEEVLADLAKGQKPFATILGCSDSRVPPEMIFDAGLGDLFIVRVAGNVLGPSIHGTLQYAAEHLRTPLFVVMGHEGCGAVKAAVASRFQGAAQSGRISILLRNIVPALDGLDPALAPEALLSAAVHASVRYTMRALQTSPEGRALIEAGQVKLVGAVYDLQSGRVRFLDEAGAE